MIGRVGIEIFLELSEGLSDGDPLGDDIKIKGKILSEDLLQKGEERYSFRPLVVPGRGWAIEGDVLSCGSIPARNDTLDDTYEIAPAYISDEELAIEE